ncbi:MAG: DNA polymerase I [Gammaproteobacteria bacterium]
MVDKNAKNFVLVDGSSYLYRAYYALPHLKNTDGEHTGAIYGVSNMLSKLLRTYNPSYLCVIFDAKGKNFRHEIYDQYKANRSSMPIELSQQVSPIIDLIKSLGIKILQVPNVEADDVIATLASQNYKDNIKVLISSGDKDLAQLVNSRVTLVNSMDEKILDTNGVIKKFGVTPEKIFDYLVLVGDASDNIPGVDKVGPKTAVSLLDKYDNLESIIQNIDNIKGKVSENLSKSKDSIAIAKKLIELKKDVDIDLDPEKYIISKRDESTLSDLTSKYQLKSLSDSFGIKVKKNTNIKKSYKVIDKKVDFDKLLQKLVKKKIFSFDTETTSLDPISAKLVGFSFSTSEGEGYYVPFSHAENNNINVKEDKIFAMLNELFRKKELRVIGQNIKYDINVLSKYKITFKCKIEDTMLLSYIYNSSGKHDLDSLAKKYLDYEKIKYDDVVGSGSKQKIFSEIDISEAKIYACEDADITLRLYNYFIGKLSKLKEQFALYNNVELPLLNVISQIEQNGVMIDHKSLQKQSIDLGERIASIEEDVYKLADQEFNIGSPKQLQDIFYNQLKLPIIKKTPKGQPSTNEDVMQELSLLHDLPKLILQYRNLSKLKNTYTDKLGTQINDKTHRLHTSYNQTVTITGRLSSSNPNLQNIPIKTDDGKKIRKTFITTKENKILSADYSQIELRVMAHISKDKSLITSFLNGEDIHSATAIEVFSLKNKTPSQDERRAAKAINFGLIYGISSFGLSKQLKINNNDAKDYIEKYFIKYEGVRDFMDKIKKDAKKMGFVSTMLGRRVYVPNITHSNFQIRSAAERTAINAPIQGTAADILKIAMIDIAKWIEKENAPVKIIMQVHDELVFEVNKSFVEEANRKISQLMANCFKLDVPLLVDIGVGDNWDKAH